MHNSLSSLFEVGAIAQFFSSSIWSPKWKSIRVLLGRFSRKEKPVRDLRMLVPDGSRFYLAISRLSPS